MEKSELTEKSRKFIGKSLREIRERQGWSGEQVALMAGVKEATIRKVEQGAFNVPIDVLTTIADVLGYTLEITPSKG